MPRRKSQLTSRKGIRCDGCKRTNSAASSTTSTPQQRNSQTTSRATTSTRRDVNLDTYSEVSTPQRGLSQSTPIATTSTHRDAGLDTFSRASITPPTHFHSNTIATTSTCLPPSPIPENSSNQNTSEVISERNKRFRMTDTLIDNELINNAQLQEHPNPTVHSQQISQMVAIVVQNQLHPDHLVQSNASQQANVFDNHIPDGSGENDQVTRHSLEVPIPSLPNVDNQSQQLNMSVLRWVTEIEQREDLARVREQQVRTVEDNRHRERQLPTYLSAARREFDNIEAHYVGLLDQVCQYCSAMFFSTELPSRRRYFGCCADGKVVLPDLPALPERLRTLYRGEDPFSSVFKRDILKYNNAFQFVSCEANLRNIPGRGPFVFTIQGKMYHHLGDVVVSNMDRAKYGPIYFLETGEATTRRAQNNINLNPGLLSIIEEILRNVNPFAHGYQTLRERYEQQREENVQVPSVYLQIVQSTRNRRELDLPSVNEVVAVYSANDISPCPRLAVYVVGENSRLRMVNYYDASCDPLTFPLLFPTGALGWEMRMPHSRGQCAITLCQFYAHRLAYRQEFQVFQYGGKLTQQYIVAAYVKVEANNIEYIQRNQNRLRVEEYVGLADYLHNRSEESNLPLGRMTILPSSFVGSPRSQQQRFQDAMCVVVKLGKPSLFITITCNPRWPDITNNIPRGDQPNNHPMLVDRIFKIKLQELMDDIWKRHVFGVPLAYLYVIEFQKRGLPHAHILVILRDEDKLSDAYRIDELISEEIPDQNTEPILYDLVRSHMVHGPCGIFNQDSPCMDDEGNCTKKFPRPLAEQTTVSETGAVIYRRRRSYKRITIGDRHFNCQWIVPYNPFLLLKYRCHINVVACASLKSVKYLYKYFFKSPDQALISIVQTEETTTSGLNEHQEYNEIKSFLNTRYMSPTEAAWHLNKFAFHEGSHTIYRLPVHLPTRQGVLFQVGNEREAVYRNEITMLTGWFILNQGNLEARQHLYIDIPEHYVWQKTRRLWTRRQRRANFTIGRIYTVSVRYRELYYLRTLLIYVRGATSFEDVRTVNGRICDTFEEACRERGLLAEDAEWHRCLSEAAEKHMPNQLRQMFSYILVFCEVNDPRSLWETFKQYLCEDYIRAELPEEESINRTLRNIQNILIVNGHQLSDFRLPEPVEIWTNSVYDMPGNFEEDATHFQEQDLNEDQRTVFQTIMSTVRNDAEPRRLFYLCGAGGTGKTFLYNTIISTSMNEHIDCIAVAWTGIAASLLRFGRTVHSRFKLPVPTINGSTSRLTPRSEEGQYLRRVKLIIWDEISMSTGVVFDLIDKTLRDICQNDLPFGGKVVLVGGDFRQCLPVVTNGNRMDVVSACVKQSALWHLFQKLELSVNMRAQEDTTGYAEWLLRLGNGTLNGVDRGDCRLIQVPQECIVENRETLITQVFGDLEAFQVPHKAILTPLNVDCDIINDHICNNFSGEIRMYNSADSVIVDDGNREDMLNANVPTEFLNGLIPSGCTPHQIGLKEGVIVTILRNLNVRRGICNGTRCLIRGLGENFIDVEIITPNGRLTGDRTFIPRIDFLPTEINLPFKMRRRQFPIKMAYATTINKSQGQTYDTVGIFLKRPVFSHGQLYVVFSRAKTRNQVFVVVEPTPSQGRLFDGDEAIYTKNIVYPEALQ